MPRLKVCYWNAQGMWSKLLEFLDMLRVDGIDIACICETHFSDNTPPLIIPDYHIVRQDRLTHMGGLLTLVRKTVKFREYKLRDTLLLEHSAILVSNKVVLINTYLPGGARRYEIQAKLKNDLKILLSNTNTNRYGVFLIGDLNAKNKYWNNTKNNAAGNIILEFSQDSGHTISFPRDPTYVPVSNKKSSSTIDLVITNNVVHSSRPFTKNVLTSDHVPVQFGIDLDIETTVPSRQVNKPNTHKANWKLFREQLNSMIIDSPIYAVSGAMSNIQIDEALEFITTSTKEAFESSVPIEKVNKNGMFMTKELRGLIRERNYFRRRWLRTHRNIDKLNYKSITQEINFLIKREQCDKINNELLKCKMGDNRIYKMIKSHRRTQIPPLLGENNERVYEDEDKARTLANHFKKMHNNTMASHDMIFTMGIDTQVKEIMKLDHVVPSCEFISSREVFTTIRNLKNGKAPGPDNITVATLKNYSHIGIELLTNIYNSCLTNGYFPAKWKIACTVAVHKQGKDPNLSSSYRPIALLCLFSRVFERILNKKIIAWADKIKAFPDFQFGFREKHSAPHALLSTFKCIKQGLALRKTTGVLSFDIEKAFDRVWHNGLIYKMNKLNFPLYIVKITKSFLTHRFFYVKVGAAKSELISIKWGVPQGSALSPTLYNIYISDIPRTLAEHTEIKQYADDTVIHTSDRFINKIKKRLQDSAEIIKKYYHKWKIKINEEKTILTCFSNRITKQLPDHTLTISNIEVPWTSDMKYLGITFDKHLTLSTHINLTCTKVDSAIRCLYPYMNRNSKIAPELKIHLYKTYIRPLLTYAAPVTLEASKTNLYKLQRKQTKILRMVLGISWDDFMSNEAIENLAKTPNLRDFMYKINMSFKSKCCLSTNKLIRELAL